MILKGYLQGSPFVYKYLWFLSFLYKPLPYFVEHFPEYTTPPFFFTNFSNQLKSSLFNARHKLSNLCIIMANYKIH